LRVLAHAEEKAACKSQTNAVAVDMETWGAAQAAERAGARWVAIRAVTDGANDTLPLDFNAFADAQANPDRGRIMRHILLRPWKIPALIRLGARSSHAARRLASFLEAFLKRYPELK
jgi:hypothetical protein